jgi:predicted component of type VI protein secretion system
MGGVPGAGEGLGVHQRLEVEGPRLRRFLHLLEDATLRADLALTPGEERLIAMHPGYAEPSAHSRMDTFLTVDGTSLQFVEYNAESPAAIAYEDVLSDVVAQLPAMQRFAERYSLTKLPARHQLLETLLLDWRMLCPIRRGGICRPYRRIEPLEKLCRVNRHGVRAS